MSTKKIKGKGVSINIKEKKGDVKMKEEQLFDEATPEMEMEMELELGGEEIISEIEETVKEKVKEEEIKAKEQRHKPGPKSKSKAEKAEKKKEKKEPKLNLKDPNIIEREIKKGRLSAPCYRIEKVEGSPVTYDLLESKGIVFPDDAKYEKYDNTSRMVHGKVFVTVRATQTLKTEKFKAKHKNGEEVEHHYVRVELHKPGRAKDVVELYEVPRMKEEFKKLEAIKKKKEEDAKKKEEAKEKEKEKDDKKEATA